MNYLKERKLPYERPQMRIVVLRQHARLLSGSTQGTRNDYNPTGPIAWQ